MNKVTMSLRLCSLILLLAPAMVMGQVASTNQTKAPGSALADESWHVVRPGETLRSLAKLYLGGEEGWKELWELNPEIANPDLISPGQLLRLRRVDLPPRTAQIHRMSRRVEDQLVPLPWAEARERTLLKPRDGVRTFEGSSAQLIFSDESRLTVTENSVVYLGATGKVRETVNREMIEVVVGQADLEGVSAPGSEGIEVVLGGVRAKPRSGADGNMQARIRLPESGRASLMVYGGESQMEAGGAVVQVDEGMGTTAAQGEPPSPPEKLLPAPEGMEPAPASEIFEPRLSWEEVEGAVSYTVEVCRDEPCSLLVQRSEGLGEQAWSPRGLAEGSYFWRVTAVSPSSLDGYPSPTRSLRVVDADRDAPRMGLRFIGTQLLREGELFVSPGIEIEAIVEDGGSGVESWRPITDGAPEAPSDLNGRWSQGFHEVVLEAVDRAGNEARSEPYVFYFDPQPPEIVWGLEGGGELGWARGEPRATLTSPQRWRHRLPELRWAGPSRQWLDLGEREWTLEASSSPRLLLRPEERKLRVSLVGPVANENLQLTASRGMWITAQDEGSGVESLSYQLVARPGAGPSSRVPDEHLLVITARDRLGQETRVEWPLWRAWFAD